MAKRANISRDAARFPVKSFEPSPLLIGVAALFSATLPLETMAFSTGDGHQSISLVPGILLATVYLAQVFMLRGATFVSMVVVLAFVLALWGLLSVLWSAEPEASLSWTRKLITTIPMIWVVSSSATTRRARDWMFGGYALGACIGAVGTVVSGISGEVYRGQSSRFSWASQDPNALAVSIAVALPIVFFLLGRRPTPIYRLGLIAAVPILLLGIFTTGSRTGLIAAALALATGVLIVWKRSRIGGVSVGIALAIAFPILMQSANSGATQRMSDIGSQLTELDFSGRGQIWGAGAGVALQDPIVGQGAGTFPYAVSAVFGQPTASHNIFLSLQVELGVVGVLLMLMILGFAGLSSGRISGEGLLWVGLGLTWLCGGLTLTMTLEKLTWWLIAMASAGTLMLRMRRRQASGSAVPGADPYATSGRMESDSISGKPSTV